MAVGMGNGVCFGVRSAAECLKGCFGGFTWLREGNGVLFRVHRVVRMENGVLFGINRLLLSTDREPYFLATISAAASRAAYHSAPNLLMRGSRRKR